MLNRKLFKLLNKSNYMHVFNKKKERVIKTIALGSGKGGVGKSSLTVLLAHVLRRFSLKVGIIDADLYGPSLSLMLPPEIPLKVSEAGRIIPALSQGIKVVSLSHFTQGREAMMVRAPIANATIKKFVEDVDWGDVEVVLIDLPPGTGDIQLTLMQMVSLTGAVVITTPSKASIIDVKKSIEMFQRMNVPILGLIENMSYFEDRLTHLRQYPFGQGRGKKLAEEFAVNFLGMVPLDEEICDSLDEGSSIFENRNPGAISEILEEIGIEIRSKICDDRGVISKIEKIFHNDEFLELSCGGNSYRYKFSEIQKRCPCARCKGEGVVDEKVVAIEIRKMGNYAISVHFSSGCSQGIYTWQHLENYSSSALV